VVCRMAGRERAAVRELQCLRFATGQAPVTRARAACGGPQRLAGLAGVCLVRGRRWLCARTDGILAEAGPGLRRLRGSWCHRRRPDRFLPGLPQTAARRECQCSGGVYRWMCPVGATGSASAVKEHRVRFRRSRPQPLAAQFCGSKGAAMGRADSCPRSAGRRRTTRCTAQLDRGAGCGRPPCESAEEFELARPGLIQVGHPAWNLGLARWAQGQLQDAGDAFRAAAEREASPSCLRCRCPSSEPDWANLRQRGRTSSACCPEPEATLMACAPRTSSTPGMLDIAEGTRRGTYSDPTHTASATTAASAAVLEAGTWQQWRTSSRCPGRGPRPGQPRRAICHYRLGQKRPELEALRRAVAPAPGTSVPTTPARCSARRWLAERSRERTRESLRARPGEHGVILNLGDHASVGSCGRRPTTSGRPCGWAPARACPVNMHRVNAMSDRLEEAEKEVEERCSSIPTSELTTDGGGLRLLQNRLVEAVEHSAGHHLRPQRRRSLQSTQPHYMEGDLSAARPQAGFASASTGDGSRPRYRGPCALELDDRASAIEHFPSLPEIRCHRPRRPSN